MVVIFFKVCKTLLKDLVYILPYCCSVGLCCYSRIKFSIIKEIKSKILFLCFVKVGSKIEAVWIGFTASVL